MVTIDRIENICLILAYCSGSGWLPDWDASDANWFFAKAAHVHRYKTLFHCGHYAAAHS